MSNLEVWISKCLKHNEDVRSQFRNPQFLTYSYSMGQHKFYLPFSGVENSSCLNTRKYSTLRVTEHWYRLYGGVSILGDIQKLYGHGLSNLLWVALLSRKVAADGSRGPCHPQPLCDSVTHINSNESTASQRSATHSAFTL